MRILIVSLKFSPAFISHMTAYAKAFKKRGDKVGFFVDDKYKKYPEFYNNDECCVENLAEGIKKYDVVMVVNAAIKNVKLAIWCNKNNKRLIYVFHETDISIDRIKKEGIKSAIKLLVAGMCSYVVCKLCYKVVLPSECAYSSYVKNFTHANNNIDILPLLFCDEIGEITDFDDKLYFSYIGTVAQAHAFENYLLLIKELYKQKCKIKFLIATKSNISEYIKDDVLKRMLEEGVLKIYHNRVMSNKEINQHYLESFCVWTAYSSSTQSGVLGKSFMAGTPVLATPVGSFKEFVIAGYNGEFVDNNNIEEMREKILMMYKKRIILSRNAKKTYESIFDYKSNLDKVNVIIE